MKRVIITGATGFVGANLCRRLLGEGHEVHCLVREGYQPWRIEPIHKEIHLHTIDLSQAGPLASLVASIRPDWIFHLAAYGAYSWQKDIRQMVQTNLLATINLVEACHRSGFEIFIHTGSSSEYGFKDHAPREDEWLEPNSDYAVTKASATHYCRFYAQRHHLSIPTLRLYSVYGPYEDPGRLIPNVILHGLCGRLPPLADPATARDYIYTRDVEDAYLALAGCGYQVGGEVFNLGTGRQTSLAEVVDLSRRIFSIPIEPQWGTLPARQWDTSVWRADIAHITSALAWQPAYSFERGFRETVDWFRTYPGRERDYPSNIGDL